MVAIYTTTGRTRCSQSLAYSTDHGQTWQEYSDNPVLRVEVRTSRSATRRSPGTSQVATG